MIPPSYNGRCSLVGLLSFAFMAETLSLDFLSFFETLHLRLSLFDKDLVFSIEMKKTKLKSIGNEFGLSGPQKNIVFLKQSPSSWIQFLYWA